MIDLLFVYLRHDLEVTSRNRVAIEVRYCAAELAFLLISAPFEDLDNSKHLNQGQGLLD